MDIQKIKSYRFVIGFVSVCIITFLILNMSDRKEYDTDQIKNEKNKTIATNLNLDFSSKKEVVYEVRDIDFTEEVVDKTQKDVSFDMKHIKTDDVVETSNILGRFIVLLVIAGVGYIFVKKVGQFASND